MENSKFLHSLIHAEFNTTHSQKNNGKAYFCCNCGGTSLTRDEKETEHEGHSVIRAMKNTHQYCYKKDDIMKYLKNKIDVSGVCTYKINSTDVYFLKTKVKDNNGGESIRKQGHCCNCGWTLLPTQTEALYCSLLCKLESQSRGGVSEQQDDDVGVSLMKLNSEKKGKGKIIMGGCDEENKMNTEKLEMLANVAVAQLVEEEMKKKKKKMSYRKESRKEISRRAPFF